MVHTFNAVLSVKANCVSSEKFNEKGDDNLPKHLLNFWENIPLKNSVSKASEFVNCVGLLSQLPKRERMNFPSTRPQNITDNKQNFNSSHSTLVTIYFSYTKFTYSCKNPSFSIIRNAYIELINAIGAWFPEASNFPETKACQTFPEDRNFLDKNERALWNTKGPVFFHH